MGLHSLTDTAPAFSDLLTWAAVVDDGVILNKDGALMAGWLYRGADAGSMTEEALATRSTRLNEALASFGSGWMIHVDAIRVPATAYPAKETSAFASTVAELIDAERRAAFGRGDAHYETLFALIVTWLPPRIESRRFGALMYDAGSRNASRKNPRATGDALLDEFKTELARFEGRIGDLLALERLRGTSFVDEFGGHHVNEQLLQYLHFALTGQDHPVNLPPCPMYLDALLGATPFETGLTPRLGSTFIAAVSIDGFPQESWPAMLSDLDLLPMRYRWSTRFVFLDPHEATAELRKHRRVWRQKVRGFADQIFRTSSGPVDRDAARMVDETEAAIADAESGLVRFGYYTGCVILMDEDRDAVAEAARKVAAAFEQRGFPARIEDVNAVEAFLGSLPGHATANIRRPLLHTLNLADLLPLSGVYAGERQAPCPFLPAGSPPLMMAETAGATPFRLNLHVGDVGHTLIFGPTGAGKSTLLAMLAAQFLRYPGAQVFAFDKGRSIETMAKALGGTAYAIGEDETDPVPLAPLGTLTTEAERLWAQDWVETAIRLQGLEATPEHRGAIRRAIQLISAETGGGTLTDFIATLQDAELRAAMAPYALGGPAGHLLDGEEDGIGHDDSATQIHAFEVGALMEMGEAYALPTLLHLFHRVEQRLDGRPSLLLIDEAWLMLGHPVFREKIRAWLKVLRKANCAAVIATQSISDAVRSGLMDVILENCPTKIFLPNAEAQRRGAGGEAGPFELYAGMGLNTREIDLLSRARPKEHYYTVSPKGRRMISLALGPIALAFAGVSDPESRKQAAMLMAKHGSSWHAHWLKARGVLDQYGAQEAHHDAA